MNFNLDSIFKSIGYDVLDYIYLIDYDKDMGSLFDYLSKYKGKEFSNSERLVFINDDTEYIVRDLRFNMYNLQSILRDLDIPNFFCIVIGQSDVKDNLERLRRLLTNDESVIKNVTFQGHLIHYPPNDRKIPLNPHLVEKSYIFLNNIMRSHRCFMISWLIQQGLVDKGLVSFNKEMPMALDIEKQLKNQNNFRCITTHPFSRINETWVCHDEKLLAAFGNIPPVFKNFSEDVDTKLQDNNETLLQRAFVYISSETVFNYPDPYLSEKSFKGFVAMRPMIVFGPHGALAHLRSLGFKTWSSYWDESYDDIADPTDRFIAVGKLIKSISDINEADRIKILEDMLPILEYNRDLYVDDFVNMQTEHIRSQLLTVYK